MDQRDTLSESLSGLKGWLTAIGSNCRKDPRETRQSRSPGALVFLEVESLPGAGSFDWTLPGSFYHPLPTMKEKEIIPCKMPWWKGCKH